MERSSGKSTEVQLSEVRVKACSKIELQIESKVLAIFNGIYVEDAVLIERNISWQLLKIVRAAASSEVDAGFR